MKISRTIKMMIVAMMVMVNGCTESDVDRGVFSDEQQAFINKTEYGIYTVSQATVFPATNSQWAINETNLESRLQRDDMSVYIKYTLAEEPQSGKSVSIIISGSGVTIPTKTGQFMVLKKDSDKVWLWDNSKDIGHLIYWE